MLRKRYEGMSALGIICLALMLILLGAVAKNSQFQNPSHSNQYLKQSVKMVSSQDDVGIPNPPVTTTQLSLANACLPKTFPTLPSKPPQDPFSPLLL